MKVGPKIDFFQRFESSIMGQNQDFWHENSNIWYFLEWNIQEYLPFLAQKFKYVKVKFVKIDFFQCFVSSILGQNLDFWHENSNIWYFLGWNIQEYLPILARKFKSILLK